MNNIFCFFQFFKKSPNLRADLAFIKANLSLLPHYITKLEEQGMELMEDALDKLSRIPGYYGEELKTKLDNVLKKNPGFDHIKSISKVLSGTSTTLPEGPTDVAMFKYCPTASVDVERSFSLYKNILTDKRHSLTKESLKKFMICHCYYNKE